MKNIDSGKIVFLTMIAGRKQKDELLTALSGSGAHLMNVIYGKGTVKATFLQNALGLVPEENKVVITSLMLREKSEKIFNMLIEKFNFNQPNTGIAFIISVDKLSFK